MSLENTLLVWKTFYHSFSTDSRPNTNDRNKLSLNQVLATITSNSSFTKNILDEETCYEEKNSYHAFNI